jgi:hypothetical protein
MFTQAIREKKDDDDDKRVKVFCTDFVVIIWSRN